MSNISKKELQELLSLYETIIKNYSSFVTTMECNNIEEILANYYFAYKNGYLSVNHDFLYSKSVQDHFIPQNFKNHGILLSSGIGCCRNITFFLTHLLNEKNIKAYNLSIELRELNLNTKQLSYFVRFFPTLLGNHVINYISSDKRKIVYDATDGTFAKLTDTNIVTYNDDKTSYPAWLVTDINKGIIMPSLRIDKSDDILEIERKYQNSLKGFEKEKIYFEDFYQINKSLYKELTAKIKTYQR